MQHIVVVGSGAVGLSVGGWLAEAGLDVTFFDLPDVTAALSKSGLATYLHGDPTRSPARAVRATSELAGLAKPDLIVLAVKTYSIEKVAPLIARHFGDDTLVLALQNGIGNQRIVPRHFKRALFGVVGYNAWIDSPGVIGYQKKGPLVIGTPADTLVDEARIVAATFSRGVETVYSPHFQDAVHSKMVVNLTNSLQALIGHPLKAIDNRALFQRILTHLVWEGVTIVRAAGYKECRIGGMPPWALMWAAANLPQLLTRGAFAKNVKKMVMSSMAQDVLQRHSQESELETINGYLLDLADTADLAVPVNRAVYKLCAKHFGQPNFQPLPLAAVWREVQQQQAGARGVAEKEQSSPRA